MFVSVDGAYRVKDVLVQNCDGFNMFSDNKLVIDEGMLDYQILITYITNHLNGNIGARYARTEGRITIQ